MKLDLVEVVKRIGVGDETRTRDVQPGKLHGTLISMIYSPLVLIREYQTRWSFRAFGGRALNGMQMECRGCHCDRVWLTWPIQPIKLNKPAR